MTTELTKPKPRRRWLQYSLRTFFVLLTVLCVWLGWLTYKANEQRKAVEWVREMGGTVFYNYGFDEDGHEADAPGPKWLREMLGREFLDQVVSVGFSTTQVSDVTPMA